MKRSEMNFAQAEGVESLPARLQLKEISEEFRNQFWTLLCRNIFKFYDGIIFPKEVAIEILIDYIAEDQNKNIDEISKGLHRSKDRVISIYKNIIFRSEYYNFLKFLEYLLRFDNLLSQVKNNIISLMRKSQLAYEVIYEDDVPCIVPIGSEVEAEVILGSLSVSRQAGMDGARKHLVQAGKFLNMQDYASSVRESIHAVESVACEIADAKQATLSKALKILKNRHPVNDRLIKAFESLYSYTNSERGIRHSFLNEEASVSEDEAMFMLGACASFVTYLIRRNQSMGDQ